MALDVYFKDDIANGIVSDVVLIVCTVVDSGGDVDLLPVMLNGLRAQALQYGISWGVVVARVTEALPGRCVRALANTRVFEAGKMPAVR